MYIITALKKIFQKLKTHVNYQLSTSKDSFAWNQTSKQDITNIYPKLVHRVS